jgi:hypothetical protein
MSGNISRDRVDTRRSTSTGIDAVMNANRGSDLA